MRILILGAKGNLGSQLAAFVNNATAWDLPEVDLTNIIDARQKIIDLKPDVIINAAAYNAVDKCETDEAELRLAYELNRKVVASLAQIALELKAVFVHYSTDYVFVGDDPGGYREDNQPEPVNKYGQTKYAGELEILKLKDRLKFYLIRTSRLFGPLGSSPCCKQSFFDLMLELSKRQSEMHAIDEEESCFTYTKDLAKATMELIENNKEYGIYHLTNSGPVSWYQAVKYLFDISGISVNLKAISSQEFSRPAKRPKYSVLLNTKTEPLRSWQEALKDYLKK
ncbi:MAG: dTDP-4-dehydrorhamnose reductase [bacterium]